MSIPPDYYYLEDPNDIYSKTGIVSIAGREFEIPVAYVQGNFKRGKINDSVVLRYVLPDYKSILEFPNAETRNNLYQQGLVRSLLLEASDARPTFDVMIENTKNIGNRLGEYEFSIYGLDKFSVADWKVRLGSQPDDTFIDKGEQPSVKSFLRCSPAGKDPVPSCRHKFRHEKLLFSTHWNLEDLSKWEEHRENIIKFVNQFEIK